MLSADVVAQLALYAQLAVAVAGFAGVIGAFSQFRMHAEATAFRVRSMVSLAIGEMIFALLPIVLANFAILRDGAWTGSPTEREHMTGKFTKPALFAISAALLAMPLWARERASHPMERLADEYVAARVRHDPRLAYVAGLPIRDHFTLPDNTDAGRVRLDAEIDRLRAALSRIDHPSLSGEPRVLHAILTEEVESATALRTCR
jgi:hypothetical protein